MEDKKPTIADIFQIDISPAGKKNDLIVYDSKTNVNDLSEIENLDLKYARDNIINIIEIGHETISNLADLSNQSQQARSYEVLANMMKTLVEANKDLISLHEKSRQLKKQENNDQPKNITNQLFVGSSEELQKMISKK